MIRLPQPRSAAATTAADVTSPPPRAADEAHPPRTPEGREAVPAKGALFSARRPLSATPPASEQPELPERVTREPSRLRRHGSPDPELTNGAKAVSYRNDPYGVTPLGAVFYFPGRDVPAVAQACDARPPAGTRHAALWGRVTFVPYPTERYHPRVSPPPEGAPQVRVFLGQLPYNVTDMQLVWLCAEFGGGALSRRPERITKKQANGERMPTGCIHAWMAPEVLARLETAVHKRMLVDDTGVWYAQTFEEKGVLVAYTASLKRHPMLRVPNRPYDSVVVQPASSTSGRGGSAPPADGERRGAVSPCPPGGGGGGGGAALEEPELFLPPPSYWDLPPPYPTPCAPPPYDATLQDAEYDLQCPAFHAPPHHPAYDHGSDYGL